MKTQTQKNEQKMLPIIVIGDPEAAEKARQLHALGFIVPSAAKTGQMHYNPNAAVGHHKDPRKLPNSYYFTP